MKKVCCDYCGKEAKLVYGDEVYPHRKDLHKSKFWECLPCDARVGVHRGTEVPLGRLANLELRMAKKAAHAAFDPFWREGTWSRSFAYTMLASAMRMKKENCHIGMFNEKQCQRVIDICNKGTVSNVWSF